MWMGEIFKTGYRRKNKGKNYITIFTNLKRSRDCLLYIQKETVINSPLKHNCTTFTSRENVLIENTVIIEGIQITIFLMSSITLVRHCCFYFNIFFYKRNSQCETETNIP